MNMKKWILSDLRFLKLKPVGLASSRAGVWSARTCPRFESGDMSPHSKTLQPFLTNPWSNQNFPTSL